MGTQDARLEALIVDLVEWVAKAPRPYADVMDAWRTSCPRLTVWEDAVDRGLLASALVEGGGVTVTVTDAGKEHLRQRGRAAVPETAGA